MIDWRSGVGIGALALANLAEPGLVVGSDRHGGASGGVGRGSTATIPAAVSGGYSYNGPPYWMTIGPDGRPVVIGPPLLWPVAIPVPVPVFVPQPLSNGVPLGGPMPRRPIFRAERRAIDRKIDKVKGQQLVTIGDRLFRVGNTKKAEERFEQAAKSSPDDAAPFVRLAQVEFLRGDYADAAERFRQAHDADPSWLVRAPNIVSIYGEPRDFEKQIARLESRLLLEPGDRDAWLVLGAQLYLAGQTRRASDVFVRLTDRKPDAVLEAFLDASRVASRVAP